MSQASEIQMASQLTADNVSIVASNGLVPMDRFDINKSSVYHWLVRFHYELNVQFKFAFIVSFVVVLLYDYILTFGDEVSSTTFD